MFSFNAILRLLLRLDNSTIIRSHRPARALWNKLMNMFGQYITAIEDQTAFEILIRYARHYECFDNKDKIFGLHGILTRKGLSLPPPDYRKNITEIFRETVVTIFNQTGRLTLFIQVDGLRSALPDLPSWVLDWSQRTFALVRIPAISNNHGAKESRPAFDFIQEGRCLQAQAIIVDQLSNRCNFSLPYTDEQLGHENDYWKWTRNAPPNDPFYRGLLMSFPQHSTAILNIWAVRVVRELFRYAPGGLPNQDNHFSALSLMSIFEHKTETQESTEDLHNKSLW